MHSWKMIVMALAAVGSVLPGRIGLAVENGYDESRIRSAESDRKIALDGDGRGSISGPLDDVVVLEDASRRVLARRSIGEIIAEGACMGCLAEIVDHSGDEWTIRVNFARVDSILRRRRDITLIGGTVAVVRPGPAGDILIDRDRTVEHVGDGG